MPNFTQLEINQYPSSYAEITELVKDLSLKWVAGGQICLNTIPSCPTDYTLGTGSLQKDWSSSIRGKDGSIAVPLKQNQLKESDFTVLCTQFQGTVLEDLYSEITSRYKVGRVRLMRSEPKTCLSWHTDRNTRVHYVVKTQPGCFMVIGEEVKFLPQNTWWHVDTKVAHTAFNGSMEQRIHLVAEVF